MLTDNEITRATEDALEFKAWARTLVEIASGVLPTKCEEEGVLWNCRVMS